MPPIDRNRVHAAFHCHAAEYETYASVQRQVVARLLALLERERPAPRSALDIGCGTGMLLRELARRFPDATLAGIDLAPGMVAAAVEALAGHGRPELRHGDAEQLPFPDGSFDLVVSTSTFQWLEQSRHRLCGGIPGPLPRRLLPVRPLRGSGPSTSSRNPTGPPSDSRRDTG